MNPVKGSPSVGLSETFGACGRVLFVQLDHWHVCCLWQGCKPQQCNTHTRTRYGLSGFHSFTCFGLVLMGTPRGTNHFRKCRFALAFASFHSFWGSLLWVSLSFAVSLADWSPQPWRFEGPPGLQAAAHALREPIRTGPLQGKGPVDSEGADIKKGEVTR